VRSSSTLVCLATLATSWLLVAGWLTRSVAAQSGSEVSDAAALAGARQCFERAETEYAAGHLVEARRGFECAYVQLPSAELAWNLARVSERMGDVAEGLRYFREYLDLAQPSPSERRGVEKRIAALVKLSERQSQLARLKPGRDVNRAMSQEARTFFTRGTKLYRGRHYEAAAAAFTAALQLSASAAPELHYNLGMTAERLQRIEDACDHYRAYLDALPEAPDRANVQAHIADLRTRLPPSPSGEPARVSDAAAR
jgi:tetratricopeptide (TPR) repeat protein